MNMKHIESFSQKFVLSLSIICLVLAICFEIMRNISFDDEGYVLAYETYNTKEMATAKVAVKKVNSTEASSSGVPNGTEKNKFKAVTLENKNSNTEPEQTITKIPNSITKPNSTETPTVEKLNTPTKPIWRLPTERGYITQYEHANHIALDITSSRGTNERIYPVADGTISGIFKDNYGAKIVTVNHNISGKYYTSQYVHLSWYASDIYVGKKVTTNDCLGGMGATGYATGIHLHLTIVDCNLYNKADPNCSTLNGYYRYGKLRLSQGFKGLRSLMTVPRSWYSR